MTRRAKWALVSMAGLGLVPAFGCSPAPDPSPTGGAAGTGGAGGSAGTTGATGGTGGSADGGPGPEMDGGNADAGSMPEEACQRLATARCEKYRQCRPQWLKTSLGNFETCVTQNAATLCRNRLGIEGTSDTPATLDACTAALTTATCAQWLDNDVAVIACLPAPGALPTGAACGTPAQCQTMNCEFATGAECGTCGGPLRAAGVPCTTGNQCEKNLQCFNGLCALPGGPGAPCTNSWGCQYPSACWIDTCVAAANPGESCATRPCNDRDGVVCKNGICQLYEVANPGESCNYSEWRFCVRAGSCSSSTGTGTCGSAAAIGEACNNTAGPYCLPWASCVQGICKIPDPGMCK